MVFSIYQSILKPLDQISIDSPADYRQYLLRTILPNVLFDKILVSSKVQCKKGTGMLNETLEDIITSKTAA